MLYNTATAPNKSQSIIAQNHDYIRKLINYKEIIPQQNIDDDDVADAADGEYDNVNGGQK